MKPSIELQLLDWVLVYDWGELIYGGKYKKAQIIKINLNKKRPYKVDYDRGCLDNGRMWVYRCDLIFISTGLEPSKEIIDFLIKKQTPKSNKERRDEEHENLFRRKPWHRDTFFKPKCKECIYVGSKAVNSKKRYCERLATDRTKMVRGNDTCEYQQSPHKIKKDEDYNHSGYTIFP